MAIIDKPSDYFNSAIYTGDGSQTRTISGVGFQPDLVIHKIRAGSGQGHSVFDSVRGFAGAKCLQTNTTTLEGIANGANSAEYGFVSGVNSDGYTVNDGTAVTNGGYVNANTYTYVSWNWKAGTSFTNDASSTGIGSIDSAGSFNNDSGFSIVSYTGTGSAGTIKHGLNSVPSMIIIKVLTNTANDWCVYHQATGNNKSTFLNGTNAVSSNAFMNNTTPTSSVFSVDGSNYSSGSSRNYIAYCFAEKQGYSKFGSYVGNGNANGTFVYTGFKPAWIVRKNTSTGSRSWNIYDIKRGINPNGSPLFADTDAQEASGDNIVDLLSNGFKQRATGGGGNTSGDNYIYMAFAESPFVSSSGVPATAR